MKNKELTKEEKMKRSLRLLWIGFIILSALAIGTMFNDFGAEKVILAEYPEICEFECTDNLNVSKIYAIMPCHPNRVDQYRNDLGCTFVSYNDTYKHYTLIDPRYKVDETFINYYKVYAY